ncbi:MAG: DUF1634 domain-containing protein [Gemmatimonadales bacterium]
MASPAGSSPARRPPVWADEAIEAVLGHLLRAGVVVAAILVAAGGARYLMEHGGAPPAGRLFTGEPANLRQVAGIFHGAVRFHGRATIMAGLLVLIATPVARVSASLIAFLEQRDRTYAALTAFVLAVLAAGVMGWAL